MYYEYLSVISTSDRNTWQPAMGRRTRLLRVSAVVQLGAGSAAAQHHHEVAADPPGPPSHPSNSEGALSQTGVRSSGRSPYSGQRLLLLLCVFEVDNFPRRVCDYCNCVLFLIQCTLFS